MSFKGILYEVVDSVAHLTLNQPDISNGFNVPVCDEIIQAIAMAETDNNVRILLIKANGKVFSIGGDLVEMQQAVEDDNVASLGRIAEQVNEIAYALKRLPKPVVMSVDGPVAGAAFNLVLASDFCVASDRAKFIQAFVGVALAPDAGGIYLLTRSIGINRAVQLTMTGEPVNAEKALEYGFVYKVCESEKLEKTTERLISKLLRNSNNSYRAIKELIWQSEFSGWEDFSRLEVSLQKQLAFTEDFKEGVRAYGDKRRPNFKGL